MKDNLRLILPLATGLFSACIAGPLVPDKPVAHQKLPIRTQYVMDEDTARLKREFEREWLKRVAEHTNYTTVGMADAVDDTDSFINEWKPRILRNQAYKIADFRTRVKMVDRMINADSIAALYFGLLVPNHEILDRLDAYDENANAGGSLGNLNIQFVNGRARWKSANLPGREMSAVIMKDCVWPLGRHAAFAFINVDASSNFDDRDGIQSDAFVEFWIGCFCNGKLVWSKKLPVNDVLWMPSLENAPFGLKYTVRFDKGKACVVDCVSGDVVLVVDDLMKEE